MKNALKWLIVTVAVALSLFCATAVAENGGGCGPNLIWFQDDQGTLTISGTGPMEDYAEYGSHWDLDISKVVIEDGVTSIGNYAFYDSSLTSITIPDSVTSIGYNAFYACGLKSITIPGSVTSIETGAFSFCGLTDVIIESGITRIPPEMFLGCGRLMYVTIPDSVTSIGNSAFESCDKDISLYIPDSVTTFGDEMFPALLAGNVYCHKSSNADRWATERGLNVIYVDDIESIRTVALEDDFRLSRGQTRQLQAPVFPNYDHPTVTWSSSDPAVASVEDGLVTGLSSGQAVITATAAGKAASLTVTVFVEATQITLPSPVWLVVEDTLELAPIQLVPQDAEINLSWISSSESIATVADGVITGISPGSTVVTATDASSRISNRIRVYVCYPVTAIALSAPEERLGCGKDLQLTAEVTTQTQSYTNHLVTFTSSDESIATVDAQTGLVHTVSPGMVTFTATSASNKSASVQIEVIDDSHDHVPVTDAAIEPTCTRTGRTEGSHCEICGMVLTAQEVVPALGHTPVTDAAIEPTCTQAGLTEGSHCETCGTILKAQDLVPAQGHTFVTDAAVEPTCTQAGLTEGSHCEACGMVQTAQEAVPALGHTPVTDAAVEPTCAEMGLTEGSHCEVCGEVILAQKKVPRKAHVYVVDEAVPVGCETIGLSSGLHCEVCGTVFVAQEETPALGHTPVTDAAVEPTCEETGLTEGSHCEICGKVLVAQETVPMKAHVYVRDEAIPATCEADGLTSGFHCENCGVVFVEQSVIPALGHDWNAPTYVWSTDHRTATAQRTCKHDASHVERESVAATMTVSKAPTQTKKGQTLYTAVFANEAFEKQTLTATDIPALRDLSLLRLPAKLKAIEAEAFAGLTVEGVILPDGCTAIGPRAFADCANLIYVRIPASVTDIAADAFEGCDSVRLERVK